MPIKNYSANFMQLMCKLQASITLFNMSPRDLTKKYFPPQVVSNGLEFVHRSKPSKHLVASFPKLVNLVIGVKRKATVVNVAADGKITRKLDDPDGKVMSFVTTAFEFEDHLYLGSLNTNFIGKLPLNPTNS